MAASSSESKSLQLHPGVALPKQPQATTFCAYCNIRLAYPVGALLIACPNCTNTLDPHAPHRTPCVGCRTLLQHPAAALYIQCPKCMAAFNPRLNRPPFPSLVTTAPGAMGAPAPSSSSGDSSLLIANGGNTKLSGHTALAPFPPHSHSTASSMSSVAPALPPSTASASASASSSSSASSLAAAAAASGAAYMFGMSLGGVAFAPYSGPGAAAPTTTSSSSSGSGAASLPAAPSSAATTLPAPAAGGAAAAAVAAGAATGKAKRRKSVGEPKQARNAYMIYCLRNRAATKLASDAAGEDLNFGQIGARLGDQWRRMTADAKRPYEDEAERDRHRWGQQMAEYKAGTFVAPTEVKRKKKRQKTTAAGAAGASSSSAAPSVALPSLAPLTISGPATSSATASAAAASGSGSGSGGGGALVAEGKQIQLPASATAAAGKASSFAAKAPKQKKDGPSASTPTATTAAPPLGSGYKGAAAFPAAFAPPTPFTPASH